MTIVQFGLRASATLSLLALSGCNALSAPEIQDCENYVQGKLRSPSTYKRISADSTIMTDQKPPQVWAEVVYDAANAYGTPIRDTQICKYPLVNGRADLSQYIDHDRLLMNAADSQLESDTAQAAAPATASQSAAPKKPPSKIVRTGRTMMEICQTMLLQQDRMTLPQQRRMFPLQQPQASERSASNLQSAQKAFGR